MFNSLVWNLFCFWFHSIQNLREVCKFLGQGELSNHHATLLTFLTLSNIESVSVIVIKCSAHWTLKLRIEVIAIRFSVSLWRVLSRTWHVFLILNWVISKSLGMRRVECCTFRWRVLRIEIGSISTNGRFRFILTRTWNVLGMLREHWWELQNNTYLGW